jgi:hypothetical protein
MRNVMFSLAIMVAVVTAGAADSRKNPEIGKVRQLVVLIHKSSSGLEYEMRSYKLQKGDANYWLAEIKLKECGNCQIIPILDDNVELGAITQISEMAINAGFKDIRPFVYWRQTGNMAQIQFGPPIKYTEDEQKIEKRTAKAQ